MAKKQEEIAQKAGDIQDKMKEAEKGSPSEGQPGSKSGGKPGGGKPQPGQKQVQQAQKQMQQAGGDLKKQDPEGAARQEQKAIKELEDALKEIEERLAQLREETQLEKLARLEARFREMLTRQQKTTIDTAELEKRKVDNQKIDRLAHNPLVKEESSLADAAQQSLDIILDDGTSVVFPDVIEQLRDDLYSVAKLIEAKKTDAYTHTMQKEVEATLEELIEALQQAQKQKEGGGGGGGGGGGQDPPLLPNSAELKLLRAAQLRVNRRTQSFDTNRPERRNRRRSQG